LRNYDAAFHVADQLLRLSAATSASSTREADGALALLDSLKPSDEPEAHDGPRKNVAVACRSIAVLFAGPLERPDVMQDGAEPEARGQA